MKKFITFMLVCGFVAITVVAFAGNGPDKIVIDGIKAKKTAVTFPHKLHVDKMEGKCETCHHKWDKKAEPKACLTCHKGDDKKDAKSGYSIFHKGEISCKGCHKTKGNAEMTKCTFCHPKA